ncbi:MAG TPA: hypothetical protein VKA60_17525 [Blastocatellia bacterium]|nr:hypothetical protein [Blastocatellia bacterium]
MACKRVFNFLLIFCLITTQFVSALAQSPAARRGEQTGAKASDKRQPPAEGPKQTPADEAAARFRRILPVLPALVRGSDGVLSLNGQRATQGLVVTSANVKDPATDAFPFTAGLPVEAAEAVQIPVEQFTVALPKFYAAVPVADAISSNGWHFSLGAPFLSLARDANGVPGFGSAAAAAAATGPVLRGKLVLFDSFDYRLSKAAIQNFLGQSSDTTYESYDWAHHADIKAWRRHTASLRLALFSQADALATLNGLTSPEAAPDYLMRGGQLSLSDAFTAASGAVIDSSFAVKRLRLRVLPRGSGPMVFVEQGELFGNYFDAVRHNSSRIEGKAAVRLPEQDGWGKHRLSFGVGLARSAFDSLRVGNGIILRGEEEDELTSVTNFAGSPFESLSGHEVTGWAEDKWTPTRRAAFTAGLRYDWGTISRKGEWAPRVGFALLPLKGERTVVRGGAGVFYDLMPLTAGTFARSRQRVIQFFDDGEPITAPRALDNLLARPRLTTPHVLGFNIEVDQQVARGLFARVKAEERRGRNLLLINPDQANEHVTALVLSDAGTSRYRELEATAIYRPDSRVDLNFSYVRSSAVGDLNSFTTVLGTFEKPFIGKNRYARSRADSPNRFVAWGELRTLGGVFVSPALDLHTGFPFGFVDADNHVPNEVDFGRFPLSVSLDLGLHREMTLKAFDRRAKLQLGIKVYNLTNHFNPRDAQMGESEDQKLPVLNGLLNGPGRTYRASATLGF